VVRPFAPRDLLRLRTLQTTGTCFELETSVLVNRSPVWHAALGAWPLGSRAIHTLVLDAPEAGAPEGFIQARRHRHAPEADLVFITPALEATQRAALVWQRLVADACQRLGAMGIQRAHVALHQEDRIGLQIFRQLGFSAYTTDVVFRRSPDPALPPCPPIRTVPLSEVYEHALDQIIGRDLPESVRQVRDHAAGDWHGYPLGGYHPVGTTGRVWLGPTDKVLGAWRLHPGHAGWWLRLAVAGETDAAALVRHALAATAAVGRAPRQPVYAAVPGHDAGGMLALRECGFEPLVGRFRLIKTMTAQVREPAWRGLPVRERGADAVVTRTSAELAA